MSFCYWDGGRGGIGGAGRGDVDNDTGVDVQQIIAPFIFLLSSHLPTYPSIGPSIRPSVYLCYLFIPPYCLSIYIFSHQANNIFIYIFGYQSPYLLSYPSI